MHIPFFGQALACLVLTESQKSQVEVVSTKTPGQTFLTSIEKFLESRKPVIANMLTRNIRAAKIKPLNSIPFITLSITAVCKLVFVAYSCAANSSDFI